MSALSTCGFSRTASLRAVTAILLMVAILSTTGCAWFKKKGDVQVGTEEYVDVPAPADRAGSGDVVAPTDAETEGTRAQGLEPFPELQTVYFDYDKSNIRSDQTSAMQNNLQYLLANPDAKVYIIGHCDERGTVEYNFNLGDRRAKSVAEFFQQGGVSPDRIATVSRGEEEPECLEHSEDCWSRNRRAAFMRMY